MIGNGMEIAAAWLREYGGDARELRVFGNDGPARAHWWGVEKEALASVFLRNKDGGSVYFCTGDVERPTGNAGTCKDADVLAVRWLYCDIDPPKFQPLRDESGELLKDEHQQQDEWRREWYAKAKADGFPKQPTWVIDSGSGFHLYWRLEEPLVGEGIARQGACIRGIIAALGGDKAVFNAARVMRLPGTINPRTMRRCEVLPKLSAEGTRVSIDEMEALFPPVAAPSPPPAPEFAPTVTGIKATDALLASWIPALAKATETDHEQQDKDGRHRLFIRAATVLWRQVLAGQLGETTMRERLYWALGENGLLKADMTEREQAEIERWFTLARRYAAGQIEKGWTMNRHYRSSYGGKYKRGGGAFARAAAVPVPAGNAVAVKDDLPFGEECDCGAPVWMYTAEGRPKCEECA